MRERTETIAITVLILLTAVQVVVTSPWWPTLSRRRSARSYSAALRLRFACASPTGFLAVDALAARPF